MARETKVIQCHPDNESSEIGFYEMFGWEVIGNQRCQEQEKRNDIWYTVTFNKITLSRDKSQPWYQRVCELEEEANYMNEYGIYSVDIESYGIKEVKKPLISKRRNFFAGLFLVLQFGLYLGCEELLSNTSFVKSDAFGSMDIPSFILFIVGLVVMFKNIKKLRGLSGKKAKKAVAEYNEFERKLEKILAERRREIIEELQTLIK